MSPEEKSVLSFPMKHAGNRHPLFIPRAITQALVGDAGFTILPIVLLLAVTAFRSGDIGVVIKEVPLASIVLLGLSLSLMVELQLRSRAARYHPQIGIRFLIFGLILIAVLGTTFISEQTEGAAKKLEVLDSRTILVLVFLLFSLATYLSIHIKRESQFERRKSCPNDLQREEYYLYLSQSIENARREVLTIAEYYRKAGSLEALDTKREGPSSLIDDMEGDLKRSLGGLIESIGTLKSHCTDFGNASRTVTGS